jgi:hypothetical protein
MSHAPTCPKLAHRVFGEAAPGGFSAATAIIAGLRADVQRLDRE